jgi:hypothetical protein
VKSVDDAQRRIEWKSHVGQGCPHILFVRFDRRPVFCRDPSKTEIRIHVGIRDVMNDLAAGPSAVTVRSIELLVREPFHRLSKASRRLTNAGDLGGALVS